MPDFGTIRGCRSGQKEGKLLTYTFLFFATIHGYTGQRLE